MWFFTLFMFFTFIILGVVTGITPLYSRQSVPFGVSVAGQHTFIEERKKRYLKWNVLVSIVFSLPLFIFPFMENHSQAEMWSSIYIVIAMLGFLVYSFVLFLKYRKEIQEWKKTLPKAEQERSKKIVVDMQYHDKLTVKGHFTFFFWQILIIILTVVGTFIFYDQIPNQIPINWDSNFEVNRYIEKSVWNVLALPGMQLLMVPVFNYSNHAIIRTKQKLSPLDPTGASEKSRLFRRVWSNFLFYTTIATQLLISFLVFFSYFGQNWSTWLLMAVIVLYLVGILGGTIYLTLKYGQAGEKLLGEKEQHYADADDDAKWVLGVFYFDREDPSVFVEKRFGIGTTLNLGSWKAWIFIGGLIVFTILTLVWSFWIS